MPLLGKLITGNFANRPIHKGGLQADSGQLQLHGRGTTSQAPQWRRCGDQMQGAPAGTPRAGQGATASDSRPNPLRAMDSGIDPPSGPIKSIQAWQVLTSGVVLLLCAIIVMLFFSLTFDLGDDTMRFMLEQVRGTYYMRACASATTPVPCLLSRSHTPTAHITLCRQPTTTHGRCTDC